LQKIPRRHPKRSSAAGADESEPASRGNEILAVAASMFVLKGFDGTTMREIASAVGMLPGSLYHHFESKEQMLHGITRPFMRRSVTLYREVSRREAASPATALRCLIDAGLKLSLAEPATHALLMHQWEFFARNPDFKYVVRKWHVTHELWSGVIEAGMKSGDFRAGLNGRLITELILEQISSTVFWSQFKEPAILPEVVRAQIDLLMNGLLSNRSPNEKSAKPASQRLVPRKPKPKRKRKR
jgi:AcrR family transcriptional regulator